MQTELFNFTQAGNMMVIKPALPVSRITFASHHPLPDMAGQPPSQNVATSIAAADAIKPYADTLRKRVLRYIIAQGKIGATDEECQIALGMVGNTQRPRRVELFRQGKICLAPMMRRTRMNRRANVWVAI